MTLCGATISRCLKDSHRKGTQFLTGAFFYFPKAKVPVIRSTSFWKQVSSVWLHRNLALNYTFGIMSIGNRKRLYFSPVVLGKYHSHGIGAYMEQAEEHFQLKQMET